MKNISLSLVAILILISSCTTSKKLAYLNNLPETSGRETFAMEVPDYKLQKRDVLYITIKAMTPDGMITDYLSNSRSGGIMNSMTGESGGYLFGYDINVDGNILLPVIGELHVVGMTLSDARKLLQTETDKKFVNTTVECKLLSFKFTVIGEVKAPGTFINYNNYLTVLEAIGRAGGIGDLGRRDRVLVIRPSNNETKTYRLNLHDKNLLASEAYFLFPNDVVIVEPQSNKIFNMNLPIISFLLTSVTSTISMMILILNFVK